MRIYGYTTVAPSAGKMAGAVVFYHQVCKRFVELGHEVIVQVAPRRGVFRDVIVDGVKYKKDVQPVGADLIILHSASLECNPNPKHIKCPIMYILHSYAPSIRRDLNNLTPRDYLFANSKNTLELCHSAKTNRDVLYPIADKKYYTPLEGVHNSYTCIGSSVVKNLTAFYNLAFRNPKDPYIHVLGGYGNDNKNTRPLNMLIAKNTPDLRTIYQKTKVLIAPSTSETYSLVAREAGLQGIPVVCSDLPGFRENLGDAGLYADPKNMDTFQELIEKLKDPIFYEERSKMIREHCLKAEKENLTRLDRFIKSLG